MRLLEIYFWNALYWALYLPVSIFLHFITEQGDPIGILFVGAFFTIILTVYLALQDDCLFDRWEPAVIIRTPAPASEVPKPRKMPKPIPAPVTVQPLEVKPYVKKETATTEPTAPTRYIVGLEPGVPMRTDVDLRQLDAADDDILG